MMSISQFSILKWLLALIVYGCSLFAANAVFTPTKQFLLAQIQAAADANNLKMVLVNQSYTYSAAHDFLNDVTAGYRVATATLASVTTTDGVLDAADPVFTNLTGTVGVDQVKGAIIYIDTGVESTSRLVQYIDSGFPIYLSPNALEFTLNFNTLGILRLIDPV